MFFSRLIPKTRSRFNGKVFCIGFNKTGTTSLERALKEFGYRTGKQREGELLLDDWIQRDFRRIIELCHTADAFQDVPFSLPDTYRILGQAFPGSKFILSVRDFPEVWYDSMTRFHTRLIGKGSLPTASDLKAFEYVHKGWLLKSKKAVYGVADSDIYNKEAHVRQYMMHDASVAEYFSQRPDQLVTLNLKAPDAMEALCHFLNIKFTGQTMPYLNKS